jgi:hypothetical protein
MRNLTRTVKKIESRSQAKGSRIISRTDAKLVPVEIGKQKHLPKLTFAELQTNLYPRLRIRELKGVRD